MKEIELSSMVPAEALNLDTLDKTVFFRVKHHQYNWANAWPQVLQTGLYQRGPEVSEIGSTWLDNLNDMRALRPFNASDLNELGGEAAFLSNVWSQETTTPSAIAVPRRVLGIPLTIDTRLICYRSDLLAQAGIDASQAFATPEAFIQTLHRFKAMGIPYPLSMATGGLALHNMSSWVWGRGGHFRSNDYRKIALIEPRARQGMLDFFKLHQFLDPSLPNATQSMASTLFYEGKSVVVFTGQWVMRPIKEGRSDILPDVVKYARFARPPGVPFVGSSQLVIWRHSFNEQDCVHLIKHLTSPEVLQNIFQVTGNFPARAKLLYSEPYTTDPDYQLAVECIRSGRMMRSARLWGGVESRLNLMCDRLWGDLLADPKMDLPGEIERRVRELADHLEKTLMANW